MLQPIRIRLTALSCFETNIYQRVFLRGRTHTNKAVTDRQTNPAAARRSETRLAADPLSFREEIEENAAQRLPPTTIKNLYPVGGIQVRREDEQAALTGLRTPVWSTRHIIPVGLTVVLDVALVQDQTAPLGATK